MTDRIAELDTAIQRVINEHFGDALVDSWIVVCHSQQISAHDMSNYRVLTPEMQPHHIDVGLMETGRQINRDSWDSGTIDDDDDD